LIDEPIISLAEQVREIKRTWMLLPDWFYVICLLVSIICIFYFDETFIQVTAFLITLYCTGKLGYRAGLIYGYVRGYEGGVETETRRRNQHE